ncbi:hypothetical protein A2U01_0113518, partial [Trifolium medium]|nr:hypothetical protein [Trifolium medium]
IELGCRDVHSGVGGWRGGVGLTETVVGMGRGVVRGVSDLTFELLFSGSSSDSWHWRPDPGAGYSVRGAY